MRCSMEYCYRWLWAADRRMLGNHFLVVFSEESLPGQPCFPAGWLVFSSAPINTRSLTNKTFILNDFCSSDFLDFLLLIETWIKPRDNSTFSEPLPAGCSFFSSLWVTGWGGGIATEFKDNFRCWLLPTNIYSCFEQQLFVAELACCLFCAVVYHPPAPKQNKDFIQELSEFLADFIPE